MPRSPLPYLLTLLALALLILLLRPRWYLNLTQRVEVSPQAGGLPSVLLSGKSLRPL